jgi:hypothetical protein
MTLKRKKPFQQAYLMVAAYAEVAAAEVAAAEVAAA